MPRPARWWLPFVVLGVVVVALLAALVGLARHPLTAGPVSAVSPVSYLVPGVATAAEPAAAAPPAPLVPSPAWVSRVAAATGIPALAVSAYAAAQLSESMADPGCRLGWNTLAGIGEVESDHGRHGGASLGADGIVRPTILGPPLDGTAGNRAIPDTDGGSLDGDATWDRAVGPLQFIPQTWREWGRSSRDAAPDPNDIDDAALTAAAYLCAAGTDMAAPAGWQAAIASYNAPVEYANAVAAAANAYADAAGR